MIQFGACTVLASKRSTALAEQRLDPIGAGYRTRTCDPLITNQVLYQLS